MMRRTLARLDVSSRSMYALVEPGSCFAGTLAELALAADRTYMLDVPEDAGENAQKGEPRATLTLSKMNFGPLLMTSHMPRLASRFHGDQTRIEALGARIGVGLSAREALDRGLVTTTPDGLDWADEIRQAIESRTALSPDALTGMEANLRFGLPETIETRVFGRLSAWQNWIFIRPNAVGAHGALKVYGTGAPSKFSWERV
jgi:benzoyl-CoA-dihydrodiol lyase